jgi:hypothetical protein
MLDKAEADLVNVACGILMEGFSLSINELFRKSPIVSQESNPFGELPQTAQMAIVSRTFYQGLAQSLATLALLTKDPEMEKKIFSKATVVLNNYYQQYLKELKASHDKRENSVGEGPQAGNVGGRLILDPGHQGAQKENG